MHTSLIKDSAYYPPPPPPPTSHLYRQPPLQVILFLQENLEHPFYDFPKTLTPYK